MKRLFQREMNVPTKTSTDKTADFEVLARNRQDSDEKTTQKPKTLPRKQVSEIAQSIIDAIVADPKITRRVLAAQLGISENTVKYHLNALQSRQIITHIGSDKGGHWKVLFQK